MLAITRRSARSLRAAALVAVALAACSEVPSGPGPESQVEETRDLKALVAADQVSGSALTDGIGPPGMTFEFTWSLAARRDADGVRGELTSRADFSVFGLGEGVSHAVIDCLVVDGNTAWFGGSMVKATNGLLVPLPERIIGRVQDNGPGSEDLAYFGPAAFWAPGQSCEARPPIPMQPLRRGNFEVR